MVEECQQWGCDCDCNCEEKIDDGMIEKLVVVNCVSKIVKGGCQFIFIVLIVVGDGEGKVGFGYGKVCEVLVVIQKLMEQVCKNLVSVDLNNGILWYIIKDGYGVVCVFMQLVLEGIGVIVGGVMCVVLEVVGVKNVLVKVIGLCNLINLVCVIVKGLIVVQLLVCIVVKCGKKVEEFNYG